MGLRRHLAVGVVAALGAALAVPSAAGASTTITLLDDNTYSPRDAAQELGDGAFLWEWGPGGVGTIERHNVIQDRGLFDSGQPVTQKPEGFSVTASAGGYPYFCSIHVGMVGNVRVRPVAGGRSKGGRRVSWASAETETGTRFDVRYRAGKKWKLWRKKTRKQAGVFGRKGKPVKLKKKKAVKLQARSRAGKRASAWSPVLKLRR